MVTARFWAHALTQTYPSFFGPPHGESNAALPSEEFFCKRPSETKIEKTVSIFFLVRNQ